MSESTGADDLSPAFDKLCRAAEGLPEVGEATWFNTPSLKVRGKSFCRVKDAVTVVLMCEMADKEMLMVSAPDIYFETDHYRGWPAILVRIHAIPLDELRLRLEKAWLIKAPKTLARTWLACRAR